MQYIIHYVISKLSEWIVAILVVALIFAAGWLLQLIGKDHGRWQAFTMFLPAVALLLGGLALHRAGRKSPRILLAGVLFLIFGVVVLFLG